MDFQELENSPTTKFVLVGHLTSEDFQKSKYAITKLCNSFPKEFETPIFRPMLDVEWTEFIKKHQRKLGNGLWTIKNRVVVFFNGEILGDFSDLNQFISKRWTYVFNQDWYHLASKHLIEYLTEKTENYRQLAYLTIAINSQVKGSLLFELYNDVVPLACENFLNRCKDEYNGYLGTQVHRIVKNSWIQCGGHDLKPIRIPCENYVVPHNRRGVLSMCNNGPHKGNSTQFFITLESTPWMNYNYVAFGQLLQGEEILQAIEEVPTTNFQVPQSDVNIIKCGEFRTTFQTSPDGGMLYTADEIGQWKEIQQELDILAYLKTSHQVVIGEGGQGKIDYFGQMDQQSMDSIASLRKIKTGLCSLKSDMKSHAPFTHLPDDCSDVGEMTDYTTCGPGNPLRKFPQSFYDNDSFPRSSDITL
ncbi:unnamed protein product [Ceutorhynchus assimilis]|uniref:PPIase cyclophilin-type domain-containing protein n=1 Tax=Ceutorhynchus assimilis TaxID=467358 RepID=A0A9N9MNW7_9CUCU|nr:unnamed protein product [Ceutorhynchus assimilis]